MSKKTLPQGKEMSDATAYETDPDKLVAEATGWATALWRRAREVTGDKNDRAMHTAARWAQVPPNTIWKLRYRPPRELGVSVYNRLKLAHEKHVASVEGKVAENLASLRALPATPARRRLVAEMEEFLGIEARSEAGPPAERTNGEG